MSDPHTQNGSQLTVARVNELLSYDPLTGAFYWKVRKGGMHPGDVAGGDSGNGHIRIYVDGKRYMAHRLAWFISHGKWPREQIDHINGIKGDNRLVNLREATHAQNIQNIGKRRNNTTGYKGVSIAKPSGKYQAQIWVEGKIKHLGKFETPEEAYEAYCKAAKTMHKQFAHLG